MPTPRQAETLRWIAGYIGRHGYAPTGREIAAEGMGGVHRNSANKMVRALIAGGFLRRTGEHVRGLAVVRMIGPTPEARP